MLTSEARMNLPFAPFTVPAPRPTPFDLWESGAPLFHVFLAVRRASARSFSFFEPCECGQSITQQGMSTTVTRFG